MKINENIVVLIFLFFQIFLLLALPEDFTTLRNLRPSAHDKEGLIKGTYI